MTFERAAVRRCGLARRGFRPLRRRRSEPMKAVVQDSYGSSDVLSLRDIATP